MDQATGMQPANVEKVTVPWSHWSALRHIALTENVTPNMDEDGGWSGGYTCSWCNRVSDDAVDIEDADHEDDCPMRDAQVTAPTEPEASTVA